MVDPISYQEMSHAIFHAKGLICPFGMLLSIETLAIHGLIEGSIRVIRHRLRFSCSNDSTQVHDGDSFVRFVVDEDSVSVAIRSDSVSNDPFIRFF